MKIFLIVVEKNLFVENEDELNEYQQVNDDGYELNMIDDVVIFVNFVLRMMMVVVELMNDLLN